MSETFLSSHDSTGCGRIDPGANEDVVKRKGRIVLTEHMSGSEDGEDEKETKPERKHVATGVCGVGEWAGGVVVVTACCPSEVDAVEGALNTLL